MNQNMGAELALRDIHLPEPVTWWPLAPGWWVLLGAIIVIACIALYSVYRWNNRRKLRQMLGELEHNRLAYLQDGDASLAIKQLSVLLRRACISNFPRNDVASLTSDDWLAFLDETSGNKAYSSGVGNIFSNAPYRAAGDIDKNQIDELFQLVALTLQRIHRRRSRT